MLIEKELANLTFDLEMICQLGRRKAIFFLIMSLVFLAIGFGICIYLIDLDRRDLIRLPFLQHEYIYSILYGALLYTALVTLVRFNETYMISFSSKI